MLKNSVWGKTFFRFRLIISILFLLFFSDFARAQRTDRKQSLSFEDELVEGTAQKPDLFYLFQKKNFNYKRLIKLRENFLPEMRRNAEDVQRLRGGT